MAKLYFRASSMNSGKTTHLQQVAFNYEERGMNVILLKPSVDSKGGEKVVSRTGLKREVDLAVTPDLNVKKYFQQLNKMPSCVLVDEAQFLTPHQVDQLFWVAVILNIPVITYGLRTDFQTKVFPGAGRLLEIAHTIEEVKTICRCGSKAIFNGRKNAAGEWITEGDQVAIDDSEEISYESLCGKCYIEKVKDFSDN